MLGHPRAPPSSRSAGATAGSSKKLETLTFAGSNSRAAIDGTAAASIVDLGNALRIDVGSNTQIDPITGFGTRDSSGVVNLTGGVGGYSSVSDVLSALRDDGRNAVVDTHRHPKAFHRSVQGRRL